MSFGQVLSEVMTLGDENNENVTYRQLPSMRIESEDPMQVNLDGEPMRAKLFDFSILPQAVRFVLPARAPLQSTLT